MSTSADLRGLGDALLAEYSPYEGDGLRNHCLRIAEFAKLAAGTGSLEVDADRVHLLAMVHDLGLVTERDAGVDYLQRTWALFEREMHARGLGGQADTAARECLTLDHRVGTVADATPESEAFRQAVWIEHSFGTRRYGLARADVSDVFRRFPRDNFTWVMADFWRRVLLHEPRSLRRGVFFA